MKNILLRNIKLPFSEVKGSYEFRQSKCAQFTHKVVKDIEGQFIPDGISLSKLGRSLKRVLPQNLKVHLEKNKDVDYFAVLTNNYSEEHPIESYSIKLLTNKKGRVEPCLFPAFCHEIRHLADALFHPKIISRKQSLIQKKIDLNKIDTFFDENIDVLEPICGKKIKRYILKSIQNSVHKFIKGMPIEDKIDILQYLRYNLISEENAYKAERKIAKKIHKKNIFVSEDFLQNQARESMFAEKINLLKKMSAELITKERKIHRAKLKSETKKKKKV